MQSEKKKKQGQAVHSAAIKKIDADIQNERIAPEKEGKVIFHEKCFANRNTGNFHKCFCFMNFFVNIHFLNVVRQYNAF